MIEKLKLSGSFYMLKDSMDCFSNLIIGTDRALLFDTGSGVDDLKKAVEEITELPLLVIASHGHFDHIGGSPQFEEVFLSAKDMCIVKSYDIEKLREWIGEGYDPKGFRNIKPLNFESFSLGDIEGKVIELPGHTHGSVGIYLPEMKLLLSGDALTPVMCLFFRNHGTVEDEVQTIERVQKLDITHFITAHSDKMMPVSILDRMSDCLNNCKEKRFWAYRYPKPPYSEGFFYLHSMENEPVGVIVDEVKWKKNM